jgi:hypothetical protein
MHEVNICRNGAKAYVKNPRVFHREKSAKRGFMKPSSHSSTASGSVRFGHARLERDSSFLLTSLSEVHEGRY